MASRKKVSKKRAAKRAPTRKAPARKAPARKAPARKAPARRGAAAAKTTSRSRTVKYVYDFSQGSKEMKDLLGGKGANLAEMTNIGLPDPPGFTITTVACRYYLEHGSSPAGLDSEIQDHLNKLETAMGRKLGDPADPLLVS